MSVSSTRRAAALDVAMSVDRIGNKELEKKYGVPNPLAIARSLASFVRKIIKPDDDEVLTKEWFEEKGWKVQADDRVQIAGGLVLWPSAAGWALYHYTGGPVDRRSFLCRVDDRGTLRQVLRLFSPGDAEL